MSVNDSKIKSYCLFPQSFSCVKIQIFLFCNDFRHVFDIATGVNKSPSPTPGASNFHIWVSWNNQLYARRASKNIYRILTNLSIFAYPLIFIYVICCLISSNVLFIQPLAFCRNWEQRRRKTAYSRHKTASTNDGLPEISKMKYRNRIPEPGTTISGFADSQNIFFFNANRS